MVFLTPTLPVLNPASPPLHSHAHTWSQPSFTPSLIQSHIPALISSSEPGFQAAGPWSQKISTHHYPLLTHNVRDEGNTCAINQLTNPDTNSHIDPQVDKNKDSKPLDLQTISKNMMDYRREVGKRDVESMWFKAKLNVTFIIYMSMNLKCSSLWDYPQKSVNMLTFFSFFPYITCIWYVKLQHPV